MAWIAEFPREKIPWYPTIDKNKCVKCGMCMSCGREVYKWTNSGPEVISPYRCIVGCSTCANLCLGNAITFPDIKTLREIYKREGIWSKVKQSLIKEGKIPENTR